MAVTITNDAATTRTNLGLGDAATKTVGTASGNIPVLDSSGKLESGRMPTLKTVGGSSIIGSGDISTLPSGGTANQVLTSDASSNATWADAAGGGKILQVVHNTDSTARFLSQQNYLDVLSTSITLSSASSKVLVMVSMNLSNAGGPYDAYHDIGLIVLRGGALADNPNSAGVRTAHFTDSPNGEAPDQVTGVMVDSPSSGGAVTYSIRWENYERDGRMNNVYNGGNNGHWYQSMGTSTITLMEIGA
jgi:hypothetical protein